MISIFARIFLIKGVDSRLAGWTSETQKNIEAQKLLAVAGWWPQEEIHVTYDRFLVVHLIKKHVFGG